jgi:hypothetical protein
MKIIRAVRKRQQKISRSGSRHIYEKSASWRRNADILMTGANNQIAENNGDVQSYGRLARRNEKRWQNEGISRDVYENTAGYKTAVPQIRRDAMMFKKNELLIRARPRCY